MNGWCSLETCRRYGKVCIPQPVGLETAALSLPPERVDMLIERAGSNVILLRNACLSKGVKGPLVCFCSVFG